MFQISTAAIKFDDEWIIDSGATTHITNNKRLFDSLDSSQSSQVVVANDTKECTKGKGTCTISLVSNNGTTSSAKLQDVLYAPNIHGNMISVHKLLNNGYTVNFGNGICGILRGGKEIAVADNVNGLYRLRQTHKVNSCLESEQKDCLHYWHRVFGHRDPEAIKTMHKGNLINGMKIIDCGINLQCETCMGAKSTRLPFPKKSQSSSKAILDLIHTDVCGPMQTESIGKKRYILTLIDDYSKYTEIYFMHNKSDTEVRIKEYIAMVENKFGHKPKVFRSDRGGEYMGNEMTKFMRECGIKTQYTAPYSPQQNGVAERKNRSLVEMARCMLTDAKLPMYLWAEAVSTANFIQNCTITKGAGKIPHEAWNGQKPNAMDFQIFGTRCYVHIPTEKRRKLDNTAVEMRFIGYERGSKAYRFYDPGNRKLIISRDVKFLRNETHSGDILIDVHGKKEGNENTEQNGSSDSIKAELRSYRNSQGEITSSTESSDDDGNTSESSDGGQSDATLIPAGLESSLDEEYGRLSTSFSDLSIIEGADSDYVPSEIDQTGAEHSPRVSSRTNKGKRPEYYQAKLVTAIPSYTEPKTYAQALASENKNQWICAMKEEIAAMNINKTWELCELPKNRSAIGCKWVFKSKTDADGSIIRYKARLVAQGFSQKFGFDYDQIFAPVARQTTFRILLSIASKENLLVHHLDVTTAFLNGKLSDSIFMKQPPGFENNNKDLVCRLKKGIYGLKQAARLWNDTVHRLLTSHGFEQGKADPCFYSKNIDNNWLFVLVYVDDILLVGKTNNMIVRAREMFANEFGIKDLGKIRQYLGIEVTRDNNGIFHLNQAKYIKKIVNDFGLANAKSSNIPMQIGYDKEKTGTDDDLLLSNAQYQRLIGCLLYVSVNTRPDVSASISILAQRVSKPRQKDWNELKRVLKYLKGTSTLKLALAAINYSGDLLYGYSDANWAENKFDRKSNSGHVFMVNGGTVCWTSRKQSLVALSTCEAEFVALSEACRAAYWIRRLLVDMRQGLSNATLIHEDNQSCLALINGGERLSDRSKHIDTRFYFVKDYIERGVAECVYCPTEDMLADVLTKALPPGKFVKFRIQFGLHD